MAADHLQGRGSAAAAPAAELSDSRVRRAEQALMQRPELSIRTRIIVVFVLLFVLLSGITAAAVVLLSAFEAKIRFLESAGSYSLALEEARRNEKNFFLYGTGLPEALASASLARSHLRRNATAMRAVAGAAKYNEMDASLQRYSELLERLLRLEAANTPPTAPARRTVEVLLRTEGAHLLSNAQEVIDRERLAVNSLLDAARVAAFGSLGFMLLLIVLFGGFITRAVVQPLNRFGTYVTRIAAGNYEPIGPTRKYRDEFSSLAMAFNHMLAEIRARQEQLVRSARMAAIGTLTSGIAHELNNPLNNIGLTVEALTEDFADYSDEEKLHMLEEAQTQVERASSTVRNLLDFTRKDRSAFSELDVASAAQAAFRLVANEARLAGVSCSLSAQPGLPPIRGNREDMLQLFLNLLLNAIQAMPHGGDLKVSLAREDALVRADVIDCGVGIAPEHVEQIFEPFFTTKDIGEGTGLGLWVTQAIVEKHGGSISVESQVGRGTTFSVRLPAMSKEILEPA